MPIARATARTVIAGALLCGGAVAGAYAQQAPPDPPRGVGVVEVEAPEPDEAARMERLEVLRAELQEVYEKLFELQVRYQTTESGDQAALDSLAVERDELRARVDDLSQRIAEENAARRPALPAPPRRGEGDVYVLFEQLSRLDHDLDPEEIGRVIESQGGIGEVLALLGEQLKDLEVEVSPERVRIETGNGGKFSFTVPEEVREELSEGMREIGREINRALADSNAGARNWAEIIERLPERFATGLPDRHRRKKVIAESVFMFDRDFEVASDEIVQGDVLLVGGDAYVSGEVQGAVYVLMGDLIVEEAGLVAEDAISVGGRVVVDDRAEVLGRRMDFGEFGPFGGSHHPGGAIAWSLFAGRVVVLMALLLLVYALFGDRMALMVESGSARPGRTMLSGAFWFTAIFGLFVVASIGLAVSVIGIPVVILLVAAMGLVSLMAYLAGCELVGRRILALLRPGSGVQAAWQGAAIGVLLFELPALAGLLVGAAGPDAVVARPLTALELAVRLLALWIGFGTVVQTRLGRRRPADPTDERAPDAVSAGA